MGHITNADIVPAAIAGREKAAGNFSTHKVNGYLRYGTGHMPKRVAAILSSRVCSGNVSQVIYSYSTPIAWLDGDTWMIPEVIYSATTSSKHATHLYRISNRRYIPWDAGMEEYLRVLAGKMRYVRGYGKIGHYVAA